MMGPHWYGALTGEKQGFFSMQFYTNYAILNENLEFHKLNCAVVKWACVIIHR